MEEEWIEDEELAKEVERKDKTPAEVAKVKAPFKSWTELVKDKEAVAKLDDIIKGLKMRNKPNKALY